MFFNGVVHPEQLAMMTAVLNDYCREHGIKNGSEACESTAVMIVALFRDGYQTAGELKGALGDDPKTQGGGRYHPPLRELS